MGANKSPWLDGVMMSFLKKYYGIVGSSCTLLILKALRAGAFLEGFNDTLITLVPKAPHSEYVKQF